MKLSDLLDKKVIITNLRARDKNSALREMVGTLQKAGKLLNQDAILKALLEREAEVVAKADCRR